MCETTTYYSAKLDNIITGDAMIYAAHIMQLICMPAILVIDDEEDILLVVSAVLKNYGFKVYTSVTPLTALELIQKYKIDLLLMDINLQGFDGRNICRSLKTDEGVTIPIVLFSAAQYNFQSVQPYLADCFISKPFDIYTLKQTLVAELQKNHLT